MLFLPSISSSFPQNTSVLKINCSHVILKFIVIKASKILVVAWHNFFDFGFKDVTLSRVVDSREIRKTEIMEKTQDRRWVLEKKSLKSTGLTKNTGSPYLALEIHNLQTFSCAIQCESSKQALLQIKGAFQSLRRAPKSHGFPSSLEYDFRWNSCTRIGWPCRN